MKKKPVAT